VEGYSYAEGKVTERGKMNRRNRREFLQTAAGALAMGMTPAPTAATVSANTERVAAA